MLELRHYFDRSLVGFILLAVVAVTLFFVLVPVGVGIVEAAHSITLDLETLKVSK